MPNDILPAGYSGQLYASEPKAQVTAKSEQRDAVLTQLPLLKEVIDHLDSRIAFYESTNAFDESTLGDPEVFMHTVAANKLTVSNLTTERNFIQKRVDNL